MKIVYKLMRDEPGVAGYDEAAAGGARLAAEEELQSFLDKYTPEICLRASEILAAMRRRYPAADVLVYDNYNALAVGFSPSQKTSEAIFSIAVYPRWVSLFFLQARGLSDPAKRLKGTGKVVKHVVLASAKELNDPQIRALMLDAEAKARVPFREASVGTLVIKSISAKQRPRRPNQ